MIETLRWIIKDFDLISSFKILYYYIKKKINKTSPLKEFDVNFIFNKEKLKFTIRKNNDDFAILREIFLFEAYKSPNLTFKPEVIFDLGSHIGASAIYLGKKFKNSKIYCFEPDENSRKLLEKNLKNNNINYKLFPYAVSGSNKIMRFNSNKDNPAFSKIDIRGNVEIQAININRILKEEKIKNIDILKVDIEGEEVKVLPTIKNKVRLLMCENHMNKYSSKEMKKIIKDMNMFLIKPMDHWKILNKSEEYPIWIALNKK